MEIQDQMASMVRYGRRMIRIGAFQKTYAALRILTRHFGALNVAKSTDVEVVREALLLEITIYLSLMFLMVLFV